MRQLSPPTNLLLACLAGLGLLATLSLPWYGPEHVDQQVDLTRVANGDADGPMQNFAHLVARVFSTSGTTYSGTETLGATRTLLLILVGAVIVLSLAVLIPALRAALRDVLRAVALAAPVIVGVLAVRHPGEGHLEARWGLFVGLAVSLIMACAAWHGSGVRVKRAVPAQRVRAV